MPLLDEAGNHNQGGTMLTQLSEASFRALAAARQVDITTRPQACKFDALLRSEGLGYASHMDLRTWYADHAMAHGRVMEPKDFRACGAI